MAKPRQEIERLRERISNGERDIDSKDDCKALLEFSDTLDLLREEYGNYRHLKLLRHCTRMAEHVGGLAKAVEDREAAEDIVRWIHATYDNEETNQDYRVALRVFGKRITGSDEPPESMEWISTMTSRDYNPAPDPAQMLNWESDVKPMIDGARNPRDAALIAVQFDAGLRGYSELYELRMKNVSDGDNGLLLRVDGKTGQRTVSLIPSVPYLQKWLTEHPEPDDPEAPLWSKLDSPERYSYQRFLQCFKESAARVNVTKPVTPTNFRKSNATWLARRGANAALIEDRQGRSRGSKAVARYVARFGEDAEAQYAKLHGIEVDEKELEDRTPIECPRCTRDTPQDEPECIWCGQSIRYDAIEDIRAEKRELRNAALRLAKANPSLLDDIQTASDLQVVFEDNPKLFEEAQKFVDSLSG